MSGLLDALQWMSEHMDDKGDQTPLPSGHPVVPDYVIEAKHKEHDAWQIYRQIIEDELESVKISPDRQRLGEAYSNWLKAHFEQVEAYERWRKEQKEQK